MLTIDDIKNVGFRRAKFGGYKPEDVDAFIDDVQISFEKMIREMNRLKETNNCLNAQVKKFKEEGQSIENVISSAKETAEKSLDDARIHTSDMINEATKKSKEIMDKAKKEVEINREISERLKSESAKLRKKLDDIYKKHLEIIDEIPADVFKSNTLDSADEPQEPKKQEKEIEKKVDISKSSAPNIRKRFFEIDAKIGKDVSGGAGVRERSGRINLDEDIFSSEEMKDTKDKFKDLKFGKNFDINGKGEEPTAGAFSGLFRNQN